MSVEIKTEPPRSSVELRKAELTSKASVTDRDPPKIARWFWSAFFLMAAISMALAIVAIVRSENSLPPVNSGQLPLELPPETIGGSEHSAAELNITLTDANQIALTAVTDLIDPLLDSAYAPVYEAIPIYSDYHYSVWGEYAELSTAALGNIGGKLAELLFDGLDSRLRDLGHNLDQSFNARFEAEVEASVNEADTSTFGPLTKRAVDDAMSRMTVTVPVSTVAAISSAAAIKATTSVIAKKIATKLAIKAAAKSGGKWATAAGGAGTGAALCSWSGPGAGFCAAVGGVGAWLVADYGIVKLDEYWNREDFETDLRGMIDERKAADKVALTKALKERAEAVQLVSSQVVRDHEFTLRELYGVGNDEVCKAVQELTTQYDYLRLNLRARTPSALGSLQAAIKLNSENFLLRPMVLEMEKNLKVASLVTVGEIGITGNLPEGFRADRDISGHLSVNERSIPVGRRAASELRGFSITVVSGDQIRIHEPLRIRFVVEQHLRLWTNRFFTGFVSIDTLEAVEAADGLDHLIKHNLQISGSENDKTGVGKPTTVDLSVRLIGPPLAALEQAPQCR